MNDSSILFVYGTLKTGHSRERFLRNQVFLGHARTLSEYRLFDCGSYPGLVIDQHGIAVEGELWQVDAECLRTLDAVEGVAEGLYRRAVVQLEPPFDTKRVETYFYARTTSELRDCGSRWD